MSEINLDQVFGISRGIPETYQERKNVDDIFKQSIKRKKHLVVYGSSKQGKTCLRRRHLQESDYILVQCGNSNKRGDIYELLLKEAGASVSLSETKSQSGSTKVHVQLSGKGKIPLVAELNAQGAYEHQNQDQTSQTSKFFDIDPNDANDVIRVLKEMDFSKFIILEDFHYLSEDIQKELAFDLKVFHDKSDIVFIVIGVWIESNRLVLYNGDLAGRLTPIDTDQWEKDDLIAVIEKGESLLNIEFTTTVKNTIINKSQNNVGILQEACYRLCHLKKIDSQCTNKYTIENENEVNDVIQAIVDEQASRYQNFLRTFVEGLADSSLEMYRWIAWVLITSTPQQLKSGLSLAFVFRKLNEWHSKRQNELRQNNVLQSLARVTKLQQKHNVKPIILDYEFNKNSLRIVDGGFILFLASQDHNTLLELIGMEEKLNGEQLISVEPISEN